MVTLSDVYQAIEDSGASINVWQNPLCDTVTVEMCGNYDIFYNPYKSQTISELQTKLMHEYGHIATGATHYVYSPYQLIEKNEYKANRCRFEKFLPWAEIKKAVKGGLTEYWQLADYFNVSEEFIKKAVSYYKGARRLKF